MEVKKMRDALKTAMMIGKAGNWFFQETEIWKVLKEDRAAAGAYISACFGTVVLLASLLEPFMPSFSRKVLEQINLSDLVTLDEGLEAKVAKIGDLVEAGHMISSKEPVPLFRKITDDEVSALRQRYAGTQSSRVEQASSEAMSAPAAEKPKAAKTTPKDVKDQKKPPKAQKKAADADKPIDISRIDLRVGQITKVWKHPEAESLYIEEIDVGEGAPRTVVSGLVKYISLEDMQNRYVVLVCNLKPANMRGVKSHAMVLAATSQDGASVELVEPPKGASIGEKVIVEGYGGEADEQLNPKKKVWEQVQPDLATNETLQACWKGIPLSTKHGACTVKSISKGSIK
jgi:methionyl-tRNA synthetase